MTSINLSKFYKKIKGIHILFIATIGILLVTLIKPYSNNESFSKMPDNIIEFIGVFKKINKILLIKNDTKLTFFRAEVNTIIEYLTYNMNLIVKQVRIEENLEKNNKKTKIVTVNYMKYRLIYSSLKGLKTRFENLSFEHNEKLNESIYSMTLPEKRLILNEMNTILYEIGNKNMYKMNDIEKRQDKQEKDMNTLNTSLKNDYVKTNVLNNYVKTDTLKEHNYASLDELDVELNKLVKDLDYEGKINTIEQNRLRDKKGQHRFNNRVIRGVRQNRQQINTVNKNYKYNDSIVKNNQKLQKEEIIKNKDLINKYHFIGDVFDDFREEDISPLPFDTNDNIDDENIVDENIVDKNIVDENIVDENIVD